MYIVNPKKLKKETIYWCNGLTANWLIYEHHFPLLCKEERCFGFAKTEKLEEVLKELPFWLKITKKF
jgi:hypothetical protein